MRGVRELGRGGLAMDGDLVPGTGILGLGQNLKTIRNLESPPSLVAVGTRRTGVARFAAVGAKTSVEAATAFLQGKRTANTPSGINVHPVGKEGLLLMLQAGLGVRVVGLGVEREARNGVGQVATAGRVGSGLIQLHCDGGSDERLKSGGEGTTAG